MARVLKVSGSGYYAWRKRLASARAAADANLTRQIRTIHARSHGTYGAPRIRAELHAEGVAVGQKRVARLMRKASLTGVSRRRNAPATTWPHPDHQSANDLVRRNFAAKSANALRPYGDASIAYRLTGSRHHLRPNRGGLHLSGCRVRCLVPRIVGWAFSTNLKTRLVLAALDMAVAVRKPGDVIHHSDNGSQYTSLAFGNRCKEAGVRPSTGSVGDAYDNAMCESFFATLECELLDSRRFRSHAEARMAVFHFIEGFYNPTRRHSALGYLSPSEYERRQDDLTQTE